MNDPETTTYWLEKDERTFAFAVKDLIDRMHTQAGKDDPARALAHLESLQSKMNLGERFEQARAHLECALAANTVHNPWMAVYELKQSLDLLGTGPASSPYYQHALALAWWMLGNLDLPFRDPVACINDTWQRSLGAFVSLANRPGALPSERDWYLDRCVEMRQAISDVLSGMRVRLELPQATLQSGRLNALDILDELSVANYGQPGWPPLPLGQLQLQPSLDEFRIQDISHHLYNLRGSRSVIVLVSTQKYVVLKVKDDSMERVGLRKGDYALVRAQDEAQSGDIAAVEFFDWDTKAILRTFTRQKDKVIFRSQSADLDEPAIEYPIPAAGKYQSQSADLDEPAGKYQVFGIVLGVFKRTTPVRTFPFEEQAEPFWTTTAMPAQASEEPIPWPGDILQTLVVYAEIPAGGPKAVPKATGTFLEIERFTLEGKTYFLKSLRGQGRVVNLGSGRTFVLKVTGDSMNQAGIRDGEYVLLRRQDGAVDGDIVAVELRGEDDLATLKRYRERNGKIVLQPESDNPAHQERVFSREELLAARPIQPFYIQGIALGVFKGEL